MLHQPYRYKGKIAKTPIHKKIEGNKEFFRDIDLGIKKAKREVQRETANLSRKFRKELSKDFPFDKAAKWTKKEVAKFERDFPEHWQRRSVRTHFKRARRLLRAGTKRQRLYHYDTTSRKHRYSYVEYINSPEWRDRRNRFFQKFGRACAACGGFNKIHLHHMVYSAYDGTEPDAHLVALCETHHNGYHSKHGTSRSMIKTTMAYVSEVRLEPQAGV